MTTKKLFGSPIVEQNCPDDPNMTTEDKANGELTEEHPNKENIPPFIPSTIKNSTLIDARCVLSCKSDPLNDLGTPHLHDTDPTSPVKSFLGVHIASHNNDNKEVKVLPEELFEDGGNIKYAQALPNANLALNANDAGKLSDSDQNVISTINKSSSWQGDSLPPSTTETHTCSPLKVAIKKFQYPTSTQYVTQVQLSDCKDSIEFSQWPDDVYKKVDAVLSTEEGNEVVEGGKDNDEIFELTQWPADFDSVEIDAAVKNLESELKKPKSLGRDVGVESKPAEILDQQDSFSQWPDDVGDKVDDAVAALESIQGDSKKEKVQKSVSDRLKLLQEYDVSADKSFDDIPDLPPKIPLRRIPVKKNSFFDEDFSDLGVPSSVSFSKATVAPGPLKPGIFKEDFSDLKLNTEFASFKSASSFKSAKLLTVSKAEPTVKQKATPFFEEDFSDLDLSKIPPGFSNTGFVSSSKVLNKNKDCNSVSEKKHFSGFSTASGSKVNVSKKSLNQIQSSQIQVPTKPSTDCPITPNLKTKTGIPDNTISEPDVTSPMKFIGFATAGGSKVDVSKASLDFIRSSQAPSLPQPSQKSGFATAAGKTVDVSKESVDFIRSSTQNVGFATAGGKKVCGTSN